MLEQFFKSQIATVSDPYQCNRITDALAAAGIKFYCKTKDVNRRNAFDQARIGTLGIKPKLSRKYLWTKKMRRWHSISYTPCPIKKIFEKAIDCPLGGGLIIPVEVIIYLSMKSARDVALQKRRLSIMRNKA